MTSGGTGAPKPVSPTTSATKAPAVSKPVAQDNARPNAQTQPVERHHAQTNADNREETARHEENIEKKREVETETEEETTSVDTRKKVMRNSYKVNGYRVQAFQGGNTRADKMKAQEACNRIKQKFPDQPVYVHFYSPRWVCRVGNFKTYEEANHMLQSIRAMGYKQAIILRGKITVQ